MESSIAGIFKSVCMMLFCTYHGALTGILRILFCTVCILFICDGATTILAILLKYRVGQNEGSRVSSTHSVVALLSSSSVRHCHSCFVICWFYGLDNELWISIFYIGFYLLLMLLNPIGLIFLVLLAVWIFLVSTCRSLN